MELRREAVSDQDGMVEFHDAGEGSELSSLHAVPEFPQKLSTVAVPSVRLDTAFPVEPIFLLKIDVEGHDPAVLAGARDLLTQRRVLLAKKN